VPLSDTLAAPTLLISLVALLVALRALSSGNRNASASAAVALHAEFRNAWEGFKNSPEENKDFYFAETMNVLEIACAIYLEGSLVGVSGELIQEFANDIARLIQASPEATSRVVKLRTTGTTFKYYDRFVADQQRRLPPI
jgi:hypothetical protein